MNILELDNTYRSNFHLCKRKYFLTKELGLIPIRGSSALRYGSTWHGFIEGYYSHIKENGWTRDGEAIRRAAEYGAAVWQHETEAYGQSFDETDYRTLDNCAISFLEYCTEFQLDYNMLKVIETEQMFKTLPVKMRYHKHDEGNYPTSDSLRGDIRNNNAMNVYQGGEPHEFWSKSDEASGLNSNEKFRAVHDYYGHAIDDNQFGRTGEERATDVHAQMYSPLARLALYAETRGQNSWVNYSNANLSMRQEQRELREAISMAKRFDKGAVAGLEKQLKDTWNNFQFADQKAVLLPAQMVRPDFDGIMPENVRRSFGTKGTETMGTHYSTQKDIARLDPAKYGTGSAGREKSYAEKLPDELKPVHFYTEGADPERAIVGKAKSMVQAPLKGLYDLNEDPMNFKQLAREYSKGNSDDVKTNLYRQIHSAGYEGFHNERGVAVTFGERDVKKIADLEGLTPEQKMQARPLAGINLRSEEHTSELQ